jgi:hypothetical protein
MRGTLVAAALIALATPVFAEESPFADPLGEISFDFALASSVEKAAPRDNAKNIIIEFLELTPEQVEIWNGLLAALQGDSEGIRQEMRANNEDLREQFESGDPDAEAVGELVIANHELGRELGGLHRVYVEGFQEMLEQSQRHRLNLVRRADRIKPVIPAFRAFGLLGR